MKIKSLPRTVLVLGFVSFLNDLASEMITPLLPLFLTSLPGSGVWVVGLVEGIAESTASLLKLFSGRLADRGWNSKKLVLGGYGISNLARPLIGLVSGWGLALNLRFLDRVGKGLRTSPRDALISGSIGEDRRGYAFGFHRSLDNAGAMVGPLCAYFLLRHFATMRQVFLLSVIPGIAVILLLAFGLKNKQTATPKIKLPPLRWSAIDVRLRGLILAAGGLAFATIPEVFLVLWAREQGLKIIYVPLIWAAASAVKTLVAGPAGSLSDYVGRIPILAGGWSLRIVLLLALAYTSLHTNVIPVWTLFLAYAAALASTEGVERALVGDFASPKELATAFGLYHMVVGLAVLPGALLFGALWQRYGAASAFILDALLAAGSLLFLLRFSWKIKENK